MWFFTNGIVVFDKETRDDYLRAGFTLVEEPKHDAIIEGQISVDEALEEVDNANEEHDADRTIREKSKKSSRPIKPV